MISKQLSSLLENTGDMALKRRAKRILSELDIRPKDKILEVGCGDGYYLHLISNLKIKNLSLTGIDIDKGALKSARKNIHDKKVKLLYADVMKNIPFKSNSFDKVIMSEVCEHLPDDVKGLTEVKRVMKKNGKLIITVPNQRYPFLWDPVNWMLERFLGIHIKSGFWSGLWNQHLRLYTPDQIKKSVTKAGFQVKKKEALTYWCLPFNHYLINLTARAIHSGKLEPEAKAALNKYEVDVKRPALISFAFWFVNFLDGLNDLFPVKEKGVGVLILAVK